MRRRNLAAASLEFCNDRRSIWECYECGRERVVKWELRKWVE